MVCYLFHVQRRLDLGHMLLNVRFERPDVDGVPHAASHGAVNCESRRRVRSDEELGCATAMMEEK